MGGPRVPPQGHCRARFRLSLLVVAANEVPFYCSSSSSIFFLLSFFFLHIPMARLHTSLSASPTIRSHRRPHRRPSRPPTARIAASSAPSGLRPRRGTVHRLFCPIPAAGALAWRLIPSISACPRAFPLTSYSLLASW